MGAHGMTWDYQGGACANVVRPARGRSHAILPWPDEEAHEAKYRLANDALAIYRLAIMRHRRS